jgi:hypothetical protein
VSLTNAEILNLGVNGYGTDQALLRYRRDGARFQPRIVLIGLMLENLLRNVSVYRPAYYHKTSSISVKPRFRFDGEGSLDLAPMPVESASELRSAIRDGSLVPILMESDYWVRRAPLAYVRSRLFLSSLARLIYGAYERGHRDPERYYTNRSSEPYRVTQKILKNFRDEAPRMAQIGWSSWSCLTNLTFPTTGRVSPCIGRRSLTS